MVDGVADQVFVDADGAGVADEPARAPVDRAVLVGRHHHPEPVAGGAPGVRVVLESQVVGLGRDGAHPTGGRGAGDVSLQKEHMCTNLCGKRQHLCGKIYTLGHILIYF